ncbi:MAG: DHHA1 domain-containing protein [Lachnospiraceae bacterium]|nr:DHHA1 domain-containing protein [Lachnospiraceae bacterium]
MKEKWFVAAKKADFQAIATKFGVDQVTARLIRNRDVIGDAAVDEYLHGSLARLGDPASLKGCTETAQILKGKIAKKKKIRIIGDYDIDGVNSTYILYRALSRCGAVVDYEIPDRMKDGYGLNVDLLRYAAEEGIDTILTCDNGISAIEEIAYAKERGMTVLVTDHHEPLFAGDGEEENGKEHAVRVVSEKEQRTYLLPPADQIVNPKQPFCPYLYKKLCGAAVAWKVVCELYRLFGIPEEAKEYLEFVGFATVGDVMDLDGENRILVKEGLKRLRTTENYGMRALIQANDLDPSALQSYHIGFILGPCINASGRLDTAKRSLRLLLAEDETQAQQLAEQLKALNDERKQLTLEAVEEATAMIEKENDPDGPQESDRVLVVYLPHCHESIAGIVAGRLRERYGKPTFVVTDGENSAKGSGRSIEAYSMFEEMVKCQDLFLKFGGHPMAAGFSLEQSRISEMRHRLNENCTLTDDDMAEKVMIDVPMPIDYISEHLIEELSVLEPFGKGNEKPLFAERNLQLLSARVIGKNARAIKLQVMNRTGCQMEALYFGDPEVLRGHLIEKYGENEVQKLFWGKENRTALDVTYYPSVNEYQGRKTLQIVIRHFR